MKQFKKLSATFGQFLFTVMKNCLQILDVFPRQHCIIKHESFQSLYGNYYYYYYYLKTVFAVSKINVDENEIVTKNFRVGGIAFDHFAIFAASYLDNYSRISSIFEEIIAYLCKTKSRI